MIIDIHAHVTAPDSLYVYKSGLLSHRGAHGRGAVNATDDEIIKASLIVRDGAVLFGAK